MYIDPNKLYGGPPVAPQRDIEKEQKEERAAVLDMGKVILAHITNVEEMLTPPDDIMTSRELCLMLKIKPGQLYNLKNKYKLPCHKPTGKDLYFIRSEVKEWLKTNNKHSRSSNVTL